MIRAVIDTNVLVSAMISPRGNEALLVLAISQGFVTACFSRDILHEYSEVLVRSKFGFFRAEVSRLIEMLQSDGELLTTHPQVHGKSPDPGDDKFIACALSAHADFLVTGNKRDFPEHLLTPTRVVRAGELLDLITVEM